MSKEEFDKAVDTICDSAINGFRSHDVSEELLIQALRHRKSRIVDEMIFANSKAKAMRDHAAENEGELQLRLHHKALAYDNKLITAQIANKQIDDAIKGLLGIGVKHERD